MGGLLRRQRTARSWCGQCSRGGPAWGRKYAGSITQRAAIHPCFERHSLVCEMVGRLCRGDQLPAFGLYLLDERPECFAGGEIANLIEVRAGINPFARTQRFVTGEKAIHSVHLAIPVQARSGSTY